MKMTKTYIESVPNCRNGYYFIDGFTQIKTEDNQLIEFDFEQCYTTNELAEKKIESLQSIKEIILV